MDAFGHVNNARYLTLFEEARTELIARAPAADGLGGLMSGVLVARHEIDYLRQIDYATEPVRIDVWVEQVRNASFTVAYELYDREAAADGSLPVACRARTLLVPYDLAATRIRRLVPREQEWLRGWLPDGGDA